MNVIHCSDHCVVLMVVNVTGVYDEGESEERKKEIETKKKYIN